MNLKLQDKRKIIILNKNFKEFRLLLNCRKLKLNLQEHVDFIKLFLI